MKRKWLAEKVLGMNGGSKAEEMDSADKQELLPMIGAAREHPGRKTALPNDSAIAPQRGEKLFSPLNQLPKIRTASATPSAWLLSDAAEADNCSTIAAFCCVRLSS